MLRKLIVGLLLVLASVGASAQALDCAIGGGLGGAIGNRFGGGLGKTLLTIAGAAGGCYVATHQQPQVVYVQAPQTVGYAGGGQVANTCTQQEVDNATGKVIRYLPVGCTPPGQTTTQVAVAPVVQQLVAADGCARFNGTAAEFSCREAARAAYDIEMGRIQQQAAAAGRAAAMRPMW